MIQFAWQGPREATIEIPPSLSLFDGHFPGEPILPAAAIVDISLQFLRNAKASVADPLDLVQAKFMRPILPDARLTLKAEARQCRLEYRLERKHDLGTDRDINGSWKVNWQALQPIGRRPPKF